MEEREKVIIFPKWKDNLEEKAKTAMQENQFNQAFEYFDQLTDNGVQTHEVMTGKLICMMELNMQADAEELCEELIAKKDNYYASYVHIYATLLFQSSKYSEVMHIVEDALLHTDIPSHIINQLQHMYQLSKELQQHEDQNSYADVLERLNVAVFERNDRQQWYLVKRLLKLGVYHDKPLLRDMLAEPTIHPVVKTALLEYFEHVKLKEPIHIEKFQIKDIWQVEEANPVLPVTFTTGVLHYLDDLQHENPTEYQMIQFILERFMYVYTPFLPHVENYQLLADALCYYVNKSFQLVEPEDERQTSNLKKHYVNMIETSETLYGSLLDV
ncbi:hypothetical protein MUN88_14450 [Gracilibacillus caseinilyticus]|uniref:Tetratricopeptide repeat-containing protein n=1 Tax=Gracilibacillus caseinilyticus TaxID=2932256 RepID=A0ABY4ESD2_9BACI|nr:hypothetical protein [Gracilibacillus caseinilyticus]UOQ47265.1 hypothetical protein MUN88_14450 [Gracilibacillus caseinilyticus]